MLDVIASVLAGWLGIQLLGVAGLPLAWRLFSALPDRGYIFAKPLGLFLVSYIFWLENLVFPLNHVPGILLSLILVTILSLWWGHEGLRRQGDGKRPLFLWLAVHRRRILAVEVLFLLAAILWGTFRAYNPELASGEKPMELTLLNAVLHSARFPPIDPWLSGFSVRYYYFGYIMLAVLVRLTGVPAGIGFNMAQALWFALVVVGAYSMAYNLIVPTSRSRHVVVAALLGPFLVVGIGNLEGIFEIAHAKGIGSAAFYEWLDIEDAGNGALAAAPLSDTWYPPGNWWGRAARVINDRDLRGVHFDVIGEFPYFSFLWGDMHPHVLALPFVLLAIALALNLLLATQKSGIGDTAPGSAHTDTIALCRRITMHVLGLGQQARRAWSTLAVATGLGSGGVLLYALILGGLGFLNTWDFPIYLGLLTIVYGMRRSQERGQWDGRVVWDTAACAAILGSLGWAFYLPFYRASLPAAAIGLAPNLLFPTKLRHFLLMFGVFVIPLAGLLSWATPRHDGRSVRRLVLRLLPWILILPLLFVFLLLTLSLVLPGERQFVNWLLSRPPIQETVAARSFLPLFLVMARLRLLTPLVYVLLGAGLAWVVALVWLHRPRQDRRPAQADLCTLIALLMVGMALLLVYSVESIHLHRTSISRNQTVFKFYYQAWTLMALASAYALYRLSQVPGILARGALAATAVILLMALYYPVAAAYSKANGFRSTPTLDGLHYFRLWRPDEATAIDWLRENVPPDSVVLEADGKSWNVLTARVSAQTGLPTLIGWRWHQLLWRGNEPELTRRETAIRTIYTTQDDLERRRLLKEFAIDYVFVGQVEQERFALDAANVEMLGHSMRLVYKNASVHIFQRTTDEVVKP